MTATQNYIETPQFFYYNTEGRITAKMLSDSLLGLEGVIRRSSDVLSRFTEVRVKDTQLIIDSITFGSYKENLLVRLCLGKGRQLERNLEKLRAKLGMKDLNMTKLSALFVAVLITYVVHLHLSKADPKTVDPKTVIHIENSFNNWGGELGVTKEELLGLIEASIKNKTELERDVIRLTHPDGNEEVGSITLDKEGNVVIPKSVLKALPVEYKKDSEEPPSEELNNVDIQVRATDLDSPNSGWACVVLNVSDKRLPLELGEGIQRGSVPSGRFVKADITVEYKTNRAGQKVPKGYILRKLRSAEAKIAAD